MTSGTETPVPQNRTSKEDLAFLIAEGVTDTTLESCQAFAATLLHELGNPGQISPGARIILLREVLVRVVEEHRRLAFERRGEGTYRRAAHQQSCQVAACGELLSMTDDLFAPLRDHRCTQFGESWEALKAKDDNRGAAAETQLRAALWVGGRSARNMAADRQQPKLLCALESAAKVYARQNRAELNTLIAADPKALRNPDIGPPRPDLPSTGHREWFRRLIKDRRGWLAIGTVTVAITLGVLATVRNSPSRVDAPAPTTERQTPSLTAAGAIGPQRIEEIPACSSLGRDSQWARELRSRRQAIVDGRCYPDPALDVGAQTGPGRTFTAAAHLATGQVIQDICLKTGQRTSDMIGSASTVWVRFRLDEQRQAYVSAVWVQGEEGADPC